MSLLSDYLLKEQQIKKLREELQKLEQDQRLKVELEFKGKLESLMGEFDKSVSEVIEILAPQGESTSRDVAKSGGKGTGTRRKRKLKIYKNPHTGDVIETRGGNHKELKEWKEQYGAETVESWLEGTEA
ncbi:histone-like nucleoid-structuring protein, MvaT/MvaU family [Halotalea alkalilenta]|uniref:H-NS histone n=1 Tax=Halotalea alkalilenta TaxID=376489 RepID=A0A172YEM6_9GAMM|nr:histone-like nucleoid-structuring protein, MvaT/MvaU family [Halotalea alkalilenta]ANF57657.1 H-NS histone [Halotalea alkalilenta]